MDKPLCWWPLGSSWLFPWKREGDDQIWRPEAVFPEEQSWTLWIFSSEFHLISQHEINIALKKVFVSPLLNGKFQNPPVTFPPIMQEEAFSPKTRVDSVPAPGGSLEVLP